MRLNSFTVLGELGLDGSIAPVAGVLPAAIGANGRGQGLICPAACGAEAAWASPELEIVAAQSLIQLANHFKGTQVLARPQPKIRERASAPVDLSDIKGQESAKRALEVAAAGGHNLLMVGPPGAGKSMLAARLAVDPAAAFAGRIAGSLDDRFGRRRNRRRRPDQPAAVSLAASFRLDAGAGRRRTARAAWRNFARASTACCFSTSCRNSGRRCSNSLRQPLETGEVSIARANHRITYPARFMLVAAMNPCRCGRASEPGFTCKRGAERPLRRGISGPAVGPAARPHRPAYRGTGGHGRRPDPAGSGRRQPRCRRPRRARPRYPGRALRRARFRIIYAPTRRSAVRCLKTSRAPMPPGSRCCARPRNSMRLSARGYHRVLRVARTLADLDAAESVGRDPSCRSALLPRARR